MPPATPPSPANAQTQWARLVVGSLLAAGVKDFIISPGSRSTPLVAAIQASAQARSTIVVDERTAAFIALGQARATGRASVLVCTSGTAPAHYLPALIEASYSSVPLVVLSADRPPEHQGNASPQTIDQHRLFGTHVRAYIDLGTPDALPAALRGLQRKLAQGIAATSYPSPGPVHFNFPARKPLEPVPATTQAEIELEQRVGLYLESGQCRFEAPTLCPSSDTVDRLAGLWSQAQRPVLFLGPSLPGMPCDGMLSFIRRTQWPVFAEATHPLKFAKPGLGASLCEHFELALRALPALVPDLVVCVGGTATSRAWLQLLAREDGPQVHVLAPYHWTDASNRAQMVVAAEPNQVLRALAERVSPANPSWVSRCARANAAGGRAVDALIPAGSTTIPTEQPAPFTEAHALRQLSAHVNANDTIVLGNSLTIRLAETFLAPRVACRCLSQRGANGIDGLIAGSVGTSLLSSNRTWLILGDVSAIHDLGALSVVAELRPALTICVLDNNGGRLFDELPIAQSAVDLSPWTTPHGSNFSALGKAFGLDTHVASSPSELFDALIASNSGSAPSFITCRVSTSGAQEVYRHLVQLTEQYFALTP